MRLPGGATRSIVLGNAYDFVFTALINGCTIGLGHQVAGARFMSHTNLQVGNAMDTAQMRLDTANEMGLNGAVQDTLLEHATYNTATASVRANDGNAGTINALVFGIRTGQDQWEFFYEQHNQLGVGNRVQYGVNRIV